MARTLHQLTVFVSGPSGVDSEKAALRVVAEEISRRTERTHGITLRVVGWPDDFRPGVSTDPQAEITRQIGADVDIYVGILGSRFGTPTPRSSSGTAEEFEAAIARFRSDSTSVRVLFYFKRGGEDPFSVDLDQLQRVRAFRDGLGPQGVLYRDFTDTAEFTQRVREHLDSLIIDEWQPGGWGQALPVAVVLPAASTVAEHASDPSSRTRHATSDVETDEDAGFLEYVLAFHEAAEGVSLAMNALTAETKKVGEETTARSAEIDEINRQLEAKKNVGGSRSQQQLVADTKTSIDRAATNLDDFVKAAVPNIEQYRTHSRALFESYRQAHLAAPTPGSRDTSGDRDALVGLITAIESSREHVISFQSSVSGLPALTSRFKRSRRRTAAMLGELVAEMSFTVEEAKSLLSQVSGPEGLTA